MIVRRARWTWVAPLALALTAPLAAQVPAPPPAEQPPIQGPTFKAGVDLIRLDVTVVDREGTPVDSLGSEDFEVKVDGKVRPVVTSRFLSLESRPLTGTPGSSLASTRDFSGNDSARRLAACS